jgi:hypothetical protein
MRFFIVTGLTPGGKFMRAALFESDEILPLRAL